MSLKITNSSLFRKHFLSLDSKGVRFYESSAFGAKRFRFQQIDFILLSPDNKLSFQVGTDVFSISINPHNAKHKNVVDTLVQEVKRTTESVLR